MLKWHQQITSMESEAISLRTLGAHFLLKKTIWWNFGRNLLCASCAKSSLKAGVSIQYAYRYKLNHLEEKRPLIMEWKNVGFPVHLYSCCVSSSRYLLPHLLPPKPAMDIHSFHRHTNNTLQRLFKMSFVPVGFWERFIARMLISLTEMDLQVNAPLEPQ